MPNIYQLKITLQGTVPPIWRRLVVPGNLTLERLHYVIQDAMGWGDCHLHTFEVGEIEIGPPSRKQFGKHIHPERQYPLDRVVRSHARFTYVYDFGDSWTHEITVEAVTTGECLAPHCVAGERACPPEDCGGIWRFADLVRAFAEWTHEGSEGEGGGAQGDDTRWSPERFDLETADRLVARHRPQPGRPRLASKPRDRSRTRA